MTILSNGGPVVDTPGLDDAPRVTAPAVLQGTEDSRLVITGVVISDADGPGEMVSVQVGVGSGRLEFVPEWDFGVYFGSPFSRFWPNSPQNGVTLEGTVDQINAYLAAGGLAFVPPADESGSVSLTIGASAPSGNGWVMSAIEVAPAPDAPTITRKPLISSKYGSFNPFDLVYIGDPDWPADRLSTVYTVSVQVDSPVKGRFLAGAGGVIDAVTGAYTVTGTMAEVWAAIDRVSFEPRLSTLLGPIIDRNRFTFTVNDGTFTTIDSSTETEVFLHKSEDWSAKFTLEGGGIREGLPEGALVATIAAVPGLTYELLHGAGGRLVLRENRIVVAAGAVFDFEADSSAPITIRVSGPAGSDTSSWMIPVLDVADEVASGSTGADMLKGGNDADRLSGGGGDDRIDGGSGPDTLDGGAGADLVIAGDGANWAYGNEGSDTLLGGAGADVMFGGADADRIDGGDGADTILGDEGNGTLIGAGGDDRILGGSSADQLYGGNGSDDLRGQDGADWIQGGEGDDTAQGGQGSDNIQSGIGADWLYGGEGDDSVFGGDGADLLFGGDGRDWLEGGSGSDQLYGGSGSDTMKGDAGEDWLDAGDGDNTAFGGEDRDVLKGGAGRDAFYGGSGSDQLYGGEGSNTLFGEDGADWIVAGTGTDTVFGGSGADTIQAGAGRDWIAGGGGADLIIGGSGADKFIARSGDLDGDVYAGFEIGTDAIHLQVRSFDARLTSLGNGRFVLQEVDGSTEAFVVAGVGTVGQLSPYFSIVA